MKLKSDIKTLKNFFILGQIAIFFVAMCTLFWTMALGYREMKEVLDEKRDLAASVEILKRNTRHYAKRQLSWFRHEKGVEFMAVGKSESPKTTARKILGLWNRGRAE